MKLSKLISQLEEKYPLSHAEEWDNVGLMIGDRGKEVKKIQISLDITNEGIKKAIAENVDLIITHHPFIFKSIKSITTDSLQGKKVIELIKNNIAVYSMHTNLDSSKSGLNDYFAERILGLKNGKIVEKIERNGREFGIGRVYKNECKIKIDELLSLLRERLKNDNIMTNMKLDKEIEKIAVITGSGSSYWRKVKKMGADILITGDLKYHEALDAKEENFPIIDVGHFESENIFSDLILKIIEQNPELDVIIDIGEQVLVKA